MGKYVDMTTKAWREAGLTYYRVEWYCVQTRRRYDCFGFIDYLLLDPARGIVGVQICGGGHAAHKRKILAEPRAKAWLQCNGVINIISWSKRKVKRGGKARRWVPRVEKITMLMIVQGESRYVKEEEQRNNAGRS